MTDAERFEAISRENKRLVVEVNDIRHAVASLVVMLHRELGDKPVHALLDKLNVEHTPKGEGDD